jgi:dipeptidyl aminopeptidase/acylaminoacyl peptidase
MLRALLVACGVAATLHATQPQPSLVSNARISPDGQSIAFVRQAGPAGQLLGVFRIGFGGQSQASLAGPGGFVSDLQWSPGGDAVAYIARSAPGAQGILRIVPATGGESRSIAAPGRDVVAYQWSIDGRRVLHESVPEGNPQGPRQLNVATAGRGDSTAPFPSILEPLRPADLIAPIHDATILFVTPAGERQQSVTLGNGKETWIDLLSSDGGRVTVMPPGIARIVEPPSWSADGTRFTVVAAPGDGLPEIFGGSLPRRQPNGFNMGAVPPMVRQLTGTPQ